ncbi:DUF1206 domain-containing protein [Portibacter marinus]|uniref:DUF1206 domain-containing protein n=1 Tax=Portibacter marinus TaxID=2898660 RepID=UPI001F458602|nr:DUF1206 domain-containing protein [Portibacter marinus]
MLEKLRESGLYTKAVLYILIGILALMAVFSGDGKMTSKTGVIDYLQNQPFGQVIVLVIGLGLAFYSIWRMSSAFLDTKNEGNDKEGAVKRTGYFVNGLIYGAIAFTVLRSFFMSVGSSGGGGSKQSLAQRVLELSYGQTLMFIVALILFGVGVYQFYKGITQKFLEEIEQSGSVESKELLKKSGTIGFISRGICFFIFAYFVGLAAWQDNSDAVRGLGGLFEFLQSLTMGTVLTVLMSLGLVAYGIFQYFLARYSSVY